ncbi:MAG: LptF/LptG family permease [Flavobacteriales bacterium]|nr:LptF/LptG family permease [Flavobacteriales bacterium]
MKRLHRMIVRAFLGPLAVTFVIVVFILVMQFLWKYVDDLMGKGLEWYVLTELLVYAAASFVPLALPLAILLSGIMTMGGLGENSELVPMRSAGLGLGRIMMPVAAFALVLAIGSFYFSNNLLPIANLKFKSLLWDVTEKKPALNIKPGAFYNGIDGFSIRVAEKDDDTGLLTDVLIYDHRTPGHGTGKVIRARKGTMLRSSDGRLLVLTLEDGRFYDEQSSVGARDAKQPMMRGTFKRDEVTMDLSGLGLRRTDEELFKDNYKMLTLGQLQAGEDSLLERSLVRMTEQVGHLRNSLYILRKDRRLMADSSILGPVLDAYEASLQPADRVDLYELAMNMARNNKSFAERSLEEQHQRAAQIAKYRVEQHRKPMLAFACVLFFFIGAPLGAIIRKGGMGLPVVAAIIFFLIFHIISFSTEKLVVAGELPAWPGMWISTLVLLPVGSLLTWKAAADSPLFDRDAYYRGWERFRSLFRRRHEGTSTLQ